MRTETTKKLFTVDEYHAMFEAGIFNQDSRVELIEGEIFEMSGPGPLHVSCVNRATMLFATRLAGKAIVSVQNPLWISHYSEPQPDVVLVKPRDDYYATEALAWKHSLLVIEVADTSLLHDLNRKLPIYAKAGVPEVWIEDLHRSAIFVYRDCTAEGYATSPHLHRGDSITVAAFPEISFKVEDLIG